MATRSATRRYSDLGAFLKEYKSTLKVGAVMLPAGSFEGELAAELKLDLILPLVGRVGPVDAQVVNRMPDGSVALRIPEVSAELQSACKQIFETVENIKQYLLVTKQVFTEAPKADTSELDATIAQLRAQVAELQARITKLEAGDRAPSQLETVASPQSQERPRGFIVPNVSRLPAARQGRLGDRSLRDGFMAWAIEKKTGLLTLSYPNKLLRWGFWFKGGPVGWRTEPLEEGDTLGILLLRASQITKEQLQKSLELMEQSGIRQGEALIELGVMSFPQLVLVLQKQTEFILQRVFKENEGQWTFHELPDLPEKFVAPPVRVAALLYRALKQQGKDLPAEALAVYLKPHLDKYVFFASEVDQTLEEMKLSLDDSGFVKIVRSTSYRLRELFAVSNLTRSGTASMIWALNELNLLEFRSEEADARVAQRVARMLDDRRRQLAKGTLFDRLELHWICTRADVEAAWKRFNDEFGADKLAKLPADQKVELEKFARGGKDAYEKLLDDRSRREYRASMFDRTMIEQSAEMLAKKGEMEIMKGNLQESLSCFIKANELMPNIGEYKDGINRVRALKN